MKRTVIGLGMVAVLCLGLRGARAQVPADGYTGPGTALPMTNVTVPLSSGEKPSPGLSRWIVGTDPDCCGELGDHNPMKTELYFRAGYSIPFGSGILVESISDGLAFQGGFRSLFFNNRGDTAWSVELGLTNLNNPTGSTPATAELRDLPFTFVDPLTGRAGSVSDPANGVAVERVNEPLLTAQIGALNRTFVNLGFGREWYLLGGAAGTRDNEEPGRWRVGLDGGGRWGSAKLQLRNIRSATPRTIVQENVINDTLVVTDTGRDAFAFSEKNHITDVIGAVYVSLHTDIDFPIGCCVYQIGARAEWDYTWSDILQIQNKSDVQSLNLLMTVGVRY